MSKFITVNETTWSKLDDLKYTLRVKSLDAVINVLLTRTSPVETQEAEEA